MRSVPVRRHQWFERGEVVALIKRYLEAPLPQAEIVRALAQTKGYDGSLTGQESKRFTAAAYAAIANAVKAGHAKQLPDGRVPVHLGAHERTSY